MNSWAVTDKGIVRSQNQDSFYQFCDEETSVSILLVCDGMGGAKAGNVASKLAEKVFVNELKKYRLQDLSARELRNNMQNALDSANTAVFELSNLDLDCRGMGTTMVAAVVTQDRVTIENVGDSRAYHITANGIFQITRDHSLVEDMIRRGEITREESKIHPNKNLITRAVGTGPEALSDFFEINLKEGEYLLLCSDGLTNIVSDDEILASVKAAEDVKAACENLLQLSLDKGAPDNVTIALLKR